MSSIKTTQIDGDVSVGRNVSLGGKAEIAGSAHIGHNLKVDGWLEAPNIKGANKGVFLTVQALREAYPNPHDGWMAGVGASTPFTAYIGNGGDWVATGGTIDVTVDTPEVSALRDAVDAFSSEVSSMRDEMADVWEASERALDDIATAKQDAMNAIEEAVSGVSVSYETIEGGNVQLKGSGGSEAIMPATKADIVNYDNTQSTINADNAQNAIDFISESLLENYLCQKADYKFLGVVGGIKANGSTETTSSSAVRSTSKMKVHPGDIIIAKGYCSASYSAITVYDSENTIINKIIGRSPQGAAVQASHIFIATAEADTVIITLATGKSPGFAYKDMIEIKFYHPSLLLSEINKSLRNVGEVSIDCDRLTWNTGNYTCTGNSTGYKWNTPTLEVCAPIHINDIPMVRVTGMLSTNSCGINFFNASLQSIGYDSPEGGYVYGIREPRLVSLPSGTEYIVFTRYIDQQTRGKAQLSLITQSKSDSIRPQSASQLFSPFAETLESFNNKNPSTPLVRQTVFGKNTDPYSTQSNRRSPALCVTNDGSFLAVCGMSESDSDASNYSALLARKAQGEDSWTYNIVLPYDSTNKNKYMNMAFCIDRTGAHGSAGRIYLFAIKITVNKDSSSTARNDGYAAYASTNEMDTVYIYSDDDGVTWSEQQSTKSSWDTNTYRSAWPGPASGIQLTDGTLVMPAEFIAGFQNSESFATKKTKYSIHSGILYKTPGNDWQFLPNMQEYWNNEDFVLEGAEPNSILLNCRLERERHKRKLYQVDINNGSFSQIDYDFDPWLVCQQAAQKCNINSKSLYLLSANDPYKDVPAINNRTNYNRSRMTVWTSTDGIRWMRALLADKNISWGYSAVASYNNITGIVYEKTDIISSSSTYDYIAFIDLTPANQLLLDNVEIANLPLEQRLSLLRERLLPE